MGWVMEGLRASDREREAATLRLRADHLEGRLTIDELEFRVAAAQAAVTVAELVALRRDLPAHRPAPSATRDRLPRLLGRRAFTHRTVLSFPPDVVIGQALSYLVPALDSIGMRVQQQRDDLLGFSNGRDRATVRVQPDGDDRTLLVAHGHAPLAIRRAFAQLAS